MSSLGIFTPKRTSAATATADMPMRLICSLSANEVSGPMSRDGTPVIWLMTSANPFRISSLVQRDVSLRGAGQDPAGRIGGVHVHILVLADSGFGKLS